MQRETKYRVQCLTHGGWEYYSLGDLVCGEATARAGEGSFDGDTWCEYVGLKAKNGREIYEGDIIEWDGRRFVVEYKAPRFTPFMADATQCEVIGNKWEHPELLEATQS